MIITEKLLSLGKMARGDVSDTTKPLKFSKPLERIIIHWIGPYPGQTVTTPWNWWENGEDGKGVRASAHFILKEENVLQCLPLDEVGWHSGDNRNHDSIGIEVIPMNVDGEFSQKTIDTLKLLIQHIRKETGTNLPLKRHFDGTQGKPCPMFYTELSNAAGGQQRWENLKLFLN
jgi:hypothetical protein